MSARRSVSWSLAAVLAAGAGACAPAGGGSDAARIRRAEDVRAGLVPDADQDRFRLALAKHSERMIADCMRAAGLRYLPRDPRSLVDTTTNPDFAGRAYAARYGFGVTAFPTYAVAADPNAGHVASLDRDHRTAYLMRRSSCVDAAGPRLEQQDGVAEAELRYARTVALVRTDPQYRRAERAWARCAAAAGLPALNRLDLIRSFERRRDTAVARLASPAGPNLADRAARDPAFVKLRASERAAAVATLGCSRALDGVYRHRYAALREPRPRL